MHLEARPRSDVHRLKSRMNFDGSARLFLTPPRIRNHPYFYQGPKCVGILGRVLLPRLHVSCQALSLFLLVALPRTVHVAFSSSWIRSATMSITSGGDCVIFHSVFSIPVGFVSGREGESLTTPALCRADAYDTLPGTELLSFRVCCGDSAQQKYHARELVVYGVSASCKCQVIRLYSRHLESCRSS